MSSLDTAEGKLIRLKIVALISMLILALAVIIIALVCLWFVCKRKKKLEKDKKRHLDWFTNGMEMENLAVSLGSKGECS